MKNSAQISTYSICWFRFLFMLGHYRFEVIVKLEAVIRGCEVTRPFFLSSQREGQETLTSSFFVTRHFFWQFHYHLHRQGLQGRTPPFSTKRGPRFVGFLSFGGTVGISITFLYSEGSERGDEGIGWFIPFFGISFAGRGRRFFFRALSGIPVFLLLPRASCGTAFIGARNRTISSSMA